MEQNNPEILQAQPVQPVQPTQLPKSNNFLVILLSVLLLITISITAFFVYQNFQIRKQLAQYQLATPSSTPTPTPDKTASQTPTGDLANWKTYINKEIGFEFSYPDTYQILTDSENLYGWPKAILLLYKGGQSYDMAVEIWSTEAEYKTKYTDTSTFSVFKTGNGKFITLSNANKDPEVAEIISTFKFLD